MRTWLLHVSSLVPPKSVKTLWFPSFMTKI